MSCQSQLDLDSQLGLFFFFLTCEVGSDVVFSHVDVQLFWTQLMWLLRFTQPHLAQGPLLITLDELLMAPWLLLLMPLLPGAGILHIECILHIAY